MDPLAALRLAAIRQLESLQHAQDALQQQRSATSDVHRATSNTVATSNKVVKQVRLLRDEQQALLATVSIELQSLQQFSEKQMNALAQWSQKQSSELQQKNAVLKESNWILSNENSELKHKLERMSDYQDLIHDKAQSYNETQKLRKQSKDMSSEVESLRTRCDALSEENKALNADLVAFKVPTVYSEYLW
jgi:regulator of replication initiation timing